MGNQKRTVYLRVDAKAPAAAAIAVAAAALRAGELVAFPTETVYGLGANAWDAAAVDAIFRAKGRPANDPLIVHIANMAQLATIAREIPPAAKTLAERFWPGALTIVLKRNPALPANLTAGLDTVAVRLPAHAVALTLLRAAALPIAAPSANRFSRPSPTRAQHVLQDLAGAPAVILDAGPTAIGVESTIVSLLYGPPRVLRPGGITLEALREVLPDVRFAPHFLADDGPASAPGSMLRHYSPTARVLLFQGADDAAVFAAMRREIARHQGVGLLLSDADAAAFAGLNVKIERLGADAEAAALRLFAALRTLDQAGVEVILARAPEKDGLGLAVWDRLLRAAVGEVIAV